MCKICNAVYVGNPQNTQKNGLTITRCLPKGTVRWYFELFRSPFFSNFDHKKSLQKCCTVMTLDILSTVNPIGSIQSWGKPPYTICMKERIKIPNCSWHRYCRLINAFSEAYEACPHIPRFHRFSRHWWSLNRWKIMFSNFQNEVVNQRGICFPGWVVSKFWKRRKPTLRDYFTV